MPGNTYEVLSESPITFAGDERGLERFFRLKHLKYTYRGVPGDHVIWRRGDFVLPVAFTDDESSVVLVAELKKAVGETLWGLPAGTIRKDESPIEAALRELREETGYTAPREHACVIGNPWYNSPDKSDERHHVVLIFGAKQAPEEHAPLPGEHIATVQSVPLELAHQMLRIGLHHLALSEAVRTRNL